MKYAFAIESTMTWNTSYFCATSVEKVLKNRDNIKLLFYDYLLNSEDDEHAGEKFVNAVSAFGFTEYDDEGADCIEYDNELNEYYCGDDSLYNLNLPDNILRINGEWVVVVDKIRERF